MPTLRAGSAAVTTGSGTATTLSFTVPSGTQVGDLICIWSFCASGSSRTFTATGYTAQASTNGGAINVSGGLLYKTAVSGDLGNSVTVTVSGAAVDWCGVIWSVGSTFGFDPTPSDGGQINAASTTITVPGQTTTKDGDLLVWPAAVRTGTAGSTPGTINPPAGFTTQVTQANTTATTHDNVGILLATNTQVTHGATGNENGSISAGVSEVNAGEVICFADASGQTASLTVAQETISAPAPTATVGAVSLALTRAQETIAAPAPTASVSASVALPVAQVTMAAPAPTAPLPTLFVALPAAQETVTALPLYAYTGPAVMPATGSVVH